MLGSVVCVLIVPHIAGPCIAITINLYKMISRARYKCPPGQLWPAGLEFDTCALVIHVEGQVFNQ